jgi:hypothetical protein
MRIPRAASALRAVSLLVVQTGIGETLAAFEAQDAVTRALVRDERPCYLKLDQVRDGSPLALGRLLLLGGTPDEQRLVTSTDESPTASPVLYHLALGDLAWGDPNAAEPRLAEVHRRNPAIERVAQLRALALCDAGRSPEAARLGLPWLSRAAGAPADRAFWEWLRDRSDRRSPMSS